MSELRSIVAKLISIICALVMGGAVWGIFLLVYRLPDEGSPWALLLFAILPVSCYLTDKLEQLLAYWIANPTPKGGGLGVL